jgi:hypothetical protein
VDYIHLAQDRYQGRILVNTVKPWGSMKGGDFHFLEKNSASWSQLIVS